MIVWFAHAKVGHCQAPYRKAQITLGFCISITKIEFKKLTVDISKYHPQTNQLNPSYLPPKVRELLLNDQFGVL